MGEINGNMFVGILGENKGEVHFRGIIHFAVFSKMQIVTLTQNTELVLRVAKALKSSNWKLGGCPFYL